MSERPKTMKGFEFKGFVPERKRWNVGQNKVCVWGDTFFQRDAHGGRHFVCQSVRLKKIKNKKFPSEKDATPAAREMLFS